MSSPFAKIFLFSPDPNQFTDSHRPVPQRGVAQRHQRGAGCGGRGSAFDEWRCSRTAKSCRSDAPMQASSLREAAQATVSNKLGHRGEREVSRKTIARGMPGRSGVTVVTNSRVFYYTRGCGRIERPAFPAPSDLRRRDVSGKTRAERAARSRSCVWRTRGCLKFESVKVFGASASFPSPLVGEGARAKRGRVRGFSPRMQTPHPARTSSAPPSPTRGEGKKVRGANPDCAEPLRGCRPLIRRAAHCVRIAPPSPTGGEGKKRPLTSSRSASRRTAPFASRAASASIAAGRRPGRRVRRRRASPSAGRRAWRAPA
jgi:hypothetical protein